MISVSYWASCGLAALSTLECELKKEKKIVFEIKKFHIFRTVTVCGISATNLHQSAQFKGVWLVLL